MHHYGSIAVIKIWLIPDRFIQVLGRKNLSFILHHKQKYVVLNICQLNRLSVHSHFIKNCMYADTAAFDILRSFLPLGLIRQIAVNGIAPTCALTLPRSSA